MLGTKGNHSGVDRMVQDTVGQVLTWRQHLNLALLGLGNALCEEAASRGLVTHELQHCAAAFGPHAANFVQAAQFGGSILDRLRRRCISFVWSCRGHPPLWSLKTITTPPVFPCVHVSYLPWPHSLVTSDRPLALPRHPLWLRGGGAHLALRPHHGLAPPRHGGARPA